MIKIQVEVICAQCKKDYLIDYSETAHKKVGEEFGSCEGCKAKSPTPAQDYDDFVDYD